MTEPVKWNEVMGFQPARRRGQLIIVSGATGLDDADSKDTFAETKAALAKMLERLSSAGGTCFDLVGVRIYLRDIEDWLAAGRAHKEVLGDVGVALTMVGATLVDPRMRVEVEGTAWVEGDFSRQTAPVVR